MSARTARGSGRDPAQGAGSGEAGRLLVVATPLGNLGDLTARAAEALRTADLILCEDTRRTRRLLAHLGAATPTRSLHRFNEAARLDPVLELLREGRTLALVSDAGTPGVSDPGARLVSAARAAGIVVEAVPGPSSPAAAISVSGMEAPGYHFAGYPPPRSGARKRFFEGLKAMERARLEADPRAAPWPLVLFEAPHRIAASLQEMLEVLGDRRVLLLREMTKLHEESVAGTLSSVASRFGDGPGRGEFTLVIEGGRGEAVTETGPEEGIRKAYQALIDSGVGRKEALRTLAVRSGRSRRDLYRELVVGEDEEDP